MAADVCEGVSEVLMATLELEEVIAAEKSSDQKRIFIEAHIKKFDTSNSVKIPDFTEELHWINTDAPLQFETHLKGKVVLLDFFTYCCINCLHVLPYLADIEKKFSFEEGLIIVGVHSGKFENERLSENIEKAVLRYGIKHPVINDSNSWLWNTLAITCWPTIVIAGPDGQIIFVLVGEGQKENIQLYTEATLKYFASRQRISSHSLPVTTFHQHQNRNDELYFPTKICINEIGDLLAVSDTGNNRVLLVDRNGYVQECIGGTEAGFCDGNFEGARFHSPQGIAWINSRIICVADTENHALREIDLGTKLVRTLVGRQLEHTNVDNGVSRTNESLSSPWDVCAGSVNDSNAVDVVFIAMAGSHQIWVYFIQDGCWLKNKYPEGSCVCIAGSGKEENRNNIYPHNAAFAQPSGLTIGIANNQPQLFVADSESSTIRMMSLVNGSVKGVVGGERDPKDLFGYGDVDGVGIAAKLQHPLGVAWNKEISRLYVADSYNHKIKVIDLSDKSSKTIAGNGKPGCKIDRNILLSEFNEPNSLTVTPCGSLIYIADTNNHSIRILDVKTSSLSEFPIKWVKRGNKSVAAIPITNNRVNRSKAYTIRLETTTLKKGGRVLLTPQISLDDGLELNNEAPHSSIIYLPDSSHLRTKRVTSPYQLLPSHEVVVSTNALESSVVNLEVGVTVYGCNKHDGCCWMKTILFEVPIAVSVNGDDEQTVNLKHCITANLTNGNK